MPEILFQRLQYIHHKSGRFSVQSPQWDAIEAKIGPVHFRLLWSQCDTLQRLDKKSGGFMVDI